MVKIAPTKAGRTAIAAAMIAGLSLTGCSAINYQATTHVYSASDGTMMDAGDVSLRHIMFVAAEEGGPARLVGLVNNGGNSDVQVEIGVGTDTFDVNLGPGESANLEHDEEYIVESIGAGPGSMQEVTVTVSGGGETLEETFGATVNDGVLAEYQDLLPDGYEDSTAEHLIHGPDTWGGGAAHYDPDDAGH